MTINSKQGGNESLERLLTIKNMTKGLSITSMHYVGPDPR